MRQAVRTAMVLWIVAWFAVILPAHQRGEFRLPGAPAGGSCCAGMGHGGSHHGDPVRSDPTRGCAICHMVFKLSPAAAPPVMVGEPTFAGLVRVAGERGQAQVESWSSIRSRAPPSAA